MKVAAIIDCVLDNSAMHQLPKEEGASPTFCLGLKDDGYSNICKVIDSILVKELSK
jgi:hypothetical protein